MKHYVSMRVKGRLLPPSSHLKLDSTGCENQPIVKLSAAKEYEWLRYKSFLRTINLAAKWTCRSSALNSSGETQLDIAAWSELEAWVYGL